MEEFVFVYELGERDFAVGYEVVRGHSGVVPDREADLLGVAEQVRRERFVPSRLPKW